MYTLPNLTRKSALIGFPHERFQIIEHIHFIMAIRKEKMELVVFCAYQKYYRIHYSEKYKRPETGKSKPDLTSKLNYGNKCQKTLGFQPKSNYM